MMYEFRLEESPVFGVSRSEIGGFDAVEFGIGSDVTDKCAYRMRVRLNDPDYFVPEDQKVRQLWYGPVGINSETGDDKYGMAFSRDIINRLIPKTERAVVLSYVVQSVASLISAVRPPYIERSTSDAKLPFVALAKYFFVGEALVLSGYRLYSIGETDEGKGWWLYQRRVDSPI